MIRSRSLSKEDIEKILSGLGEHLADKHPADKHPALLEQYPKRWLLFKLTFDLSAPFGEWIGAMTEGPFKRWASAILSAIGAPEWTVSLVNDGVIAGVGFVYQTLLADCGDDYLSGRHFFRIGRVAWEY